MIFLRMYIYIHIYIYIYIYMAFVTALVAASLVYFLGNDQWPFCEALVIIGGACTGFGAALLWTSQVFPMDPSARMTGIDASE